MRDVQTSGIGPKPSIWVCTRLHWPENLVKNEVFTQSRTGADALQLTLVPRFSFRARLTAGVRRPNIASRIIGNYG